MSPDDRDPPEPTRLVKLDLKRADAAKLVLEDEALRTAPFVKVLGEVLAERLLKTGQAMRFPDQATVFAEGDPAASLLLILRGEARLFARRGTDVIERGVVHKGEVLGEEEALTGGEKRCCSAVAAGDLQLVALPRDAVTAAISERPAVRRHLEELRDRRKIAAAELAEFLDRW